MRAYLFGVAVLALAASGCATSDNECADQCGKPALRTVDPASEAIRAAVESNASVALKLHSKLREQPGNLFYSPLSIEAVLGILYAGSAGDTEKQIGEVLGSVDDPQALHEGLGSLLKDLAGNRRDRGYLLSLANRLWAAEGLDSSAEFTEITRDAYDAPTELVDYSKPEKVRGEINSWVSDQTKGKIPTLLREGQLSANTVLTAVNAIYFKADWARRFDPAGTQQAPFHRADGTDVMVPMMRLVDGEVSTYFDVENDLQAVDLPYRGGDLSFLAFAPADFSSGPAPTLSQLEASLDDAKLRAIIDGLHAGENPVYMPRFALHSRLDLIQTFRALGVVDLFESGVADLSKIGGAPGAVWVNPFVHEATVQVDETGTEAAAATAAVARTLSAPQPVHLDQPFLFFIRDSLTGAILFSGRVADPSQE